MAIVGAGSGLGLAVARYIIRVEPLASAPSAQVAAIVGPTVQRYLTDDVTEPAPTGS